MLNIFITTDKTGRKIHLTKERWTHITSPISPHAYMTNYLEEIKQTLIHPDKTLSSVADEKKVNYYKHLKKEKRFIKVIVKYLNGEGFIISSYLTRSTA